MYLLLLGSQPILAIVPGCSPVSAKWLQQHRFPMKNIGHFTVWDVPAHLPFGTGGTLAASAREGDEKETVVLSGNAKDGATWNATITGAGCLGSFDLHVADLDKNGQQDAIFTFRIGIPDIESVYEHLLLLFDERGYPMPFVSIGWCLDEADRMLDFVDLDEDGRAEVFEQDMRNNFNIYRVNNTRWRRLSRWPATDTIPRWLCGRPCGSTSAGMVLDTELFVPAGRLQTISGETSGNTSLLLTTPSGATETIRLRHWADSHCTMIISTPRQRRILFANAHPDEWRQALREIASAANQLAVAGDLGNPLPLDEPSRPSPMIAWFTVERPSRHP